MTDIKLNLINQSNDRNNSEVVIFQKNAITSSNAHTVAWKVIQNLGRGCNHPFDFSRQITGAAADSWGNYTPPPVLDEGAKYSMFLDYSGNVFKFSGSARSKDVVEIANEMEKGAIDALIFRNGSLLATTQHMPPSQIAVFKFEPTLWIGVVSQIVQGQVICESDLAALTTKLSLTGIASADIIMTGGGEGSSVEPFEFALDNVTYL